MNSDTGQELESAVWTVGHFCTTRGCLRWAFRQLPEFVHLALFGGSSLSDSVTSAFTIGQLALRLRQSPAGARYPPNLVAVANRFVESAYAAFFPMEVVDHAQLCLRWSEDIKRRSIVPHWRRIPDSGKDGKGRQV